ncbi:MAG: DUF2029 domain-containing protein, partial [Candidatus Dormibacteraeota bacterium]|nr:DUF2029 domain-containing protein [Candidatus Dormibacteraeota bacterium]
MTSVHFGRRAGYLLALALLVTSWSLYFSGDFRNVDVEFYHLYALRFWGHLAHPSLPTEYPPLSVLVFSLTLAGPPALFPETFAVAMAVIAGAAFVVFLRLTSLRQAGAYAIYILAAGVATLFFRFDLVPALVTVAAVWLLYRRRFTAVYALLALATLLKLFPIVLLPVAVLAQLSAAPHGAKRWAAPLVGATACLAVVALGFAGAALLDPAHGLSSLSYELQRPDEVESIPATLLWFASLGGLAVRPDTGFGSLNVVSSGSTTVNILAGAALVVGLAFVYWRQHRGRLTAGQAALACVLVVLCSSKVLSAQYLIWAAPILALVVGFQLRWLFLFLLTGLI